MSSNVIRRGIVMGAALGALALSGTASAAKLHGVVVQRNQHAHSLVVASGNGHLVAVHTHRSVAPGRVVVISARQLRNGTYAARHISALHQLRNTVKIHGVVTFVNRLRGEFTVSARGASLLIKAGHRVTHGFLARAAASSSGLPSVGDEVTVTTTIDNQGDLEDQGVQNQGDTSQNIDLEGTVLAVDTTNSTLSISADDQEESGQAITVTVPSTLDISMFSVGQEVELTVSLQPDGSYLLVGSSGDENASQADNSGDQQGCQGDQEGDSCSSGSDSSGQDCQGNQGSNPAPYQEGDSCSSGSDGSDSSSSGSDNQGD